MRWFTPRGFDRQNISPVPFVRIFSWEVNEVDKILFLVLGVLLAFTGMAQGMPAARAVHLQREVQGQTITSKELPAVELTFGKNFQYLGGQVVNLYGNADAEQHLFVSGA